MQQKLRCGQARRQRAAEAASAEAEIQRKRAALGNRRGRRAEIEQKQCGTAAYLRSSNFKESIGSRSSTLGKCRHRSARSVELKLTL